MEADQSRLSNGALRLLLLYVGKGPWVDALFKAPFEPAPRASSSAPAVSPARNADSQHLLSSGIHILAVFQAFATSLIPLHPHKSLPNQFTLM